MKEQALLTQEELQKEILKIKNTLLDVIIPKIDETDDKVEIIQTIVEQIKTEKLKPSKKFIFWRKNG